MLYNVLVGFVFSQLHYTTKKAAPLLFSRCNLFFCFFTAPLMYVIVAVMYVNALGMYVITRRSTNLQKSYKWLYNAIYSSPSGASQLCHTF